MTPQDMLIMHDPENGKIGDCFRCCIASLLDFPASSVPHVMEKNYDKPLDMGWCDDLQRYLEQFDLCYFDIEIRSEWLDGKWFEHLPASYDMHHIISGSSLGNTSHAVIGRRGKVVFDPHPSRVGLVGPAPETNSYYYGFLIHRSLRSKDIHDGAARHKATNILA